MATPENTLLVRHLPSELSPVEKEGLLRHFLAVKVKVMGISGRMKHTAFATFENEESAAKALERLHQLKVLGSVLVVEFAKLTDQNHFPKLLENSNRLEKTSDDKNGNKPEEFSTPVLQQWKPSYDLHRKHGIEYPRNPRLHYLYPEPNVAILTNIANSLACHRKFYTQVLHLMNKMDLPAPFGQVTPTPPIPSGKSEGLITGHDNLENEEMDVSSEEESEIESDEDKRPQATNAVAKRPARHNPKKIRKKRKLMIPPPQEITAPRPPGFPVVLASEVFEQPVQQQPKKIQLNLPSNVPQTDSEETLQQEKDLFDEIENKVETSAQVLPTDEVTPLPVEEGGFGKIEPVLQTAKPVDNDDEDEEELIVDKSRFVSSEELRKGRISSEEMRTISVFRKYDAGEPSTRLYVKNLSKQTTEEDLLYIFGRYVDLDSEEVKNIWDIRLMKEGRMKGQAFITYPAEKPAKRAVRDVNGYVLHGRAMVVQFARSAKPKVQEDNKPN